jgi:hypothetical protein
MIPYIRLKPGRGFEPGRASLYYLQRLVCWPSLRRAVSWLLATRINAAQGAPQRRELDAASKRALDDLRRDGVTTLQPLAAPGQVKAMYDYFLSRPVLGPEGRRIPLDALPKGAASAAYDLQTIVECPGLMEIINSPRVLDIAAAYVGCKPTLSSLGVRWSFPAADAAAHYQSFHRDVDDWRFLKMFIYLTDVDEDSGPHCYVRTSHRRGFSWRARRYPVDGLAAKYGQDKLDTVMGERGVTFMADTIGIHAGGQVNRTPRLILQAQYSILPVYALKYAPAPCTQAAVDPYINRLLIRPAPAPPAAPARQWAQAS